MTFVSPLRLFRVHHFLATLLLLAVGPALAQAPAAAPGARTAAPAARPAAARPVLLDRVVAIVNDEALTQGELDQQKRGSERGRGLRRIDQVRKAPVWLERQEVGRNGGEHEKREQRRDQQAPAA